MKIKICGLTRYEDASYAVDCGAWALGFILWPHSKRAIPLSRATDLLQRLRDEGKKPEKVVGVFVNPSREEIELAVSKLHLTTIQLHGDESPGFVNDLPYEVIKAFRPKSSNDVEDMADFQCAYRLIDAQVPGAYGGTGQLSNWDLAEKMKKHGPVILSGGLGPANIKEAWFKVQPFALDLASGVESSPGIKSLPLISQVFAKFS